jgi:PIN domain nuclease of toxin-antitoxin system
LPDALVSTVNFSEAAAVLTEIGTWPSLVRDVISDLGFATVPFDLELAYLAGTLRLATRRAGLSFGDRACLALTRRRGSPALTADRAWKNLKVGVEIRLIH